MKAGEASCRGGASAPSPVECTILVHAAEPSQITKWSDFVATRPDAELYHDYRWRALIQSVFGHATYYLMARSGDEVRGVLPLVRLKSRLFGDFLVSMPFFNYGGVLADSPEAAKALLGEAARIARGGGSQHIELRHRDGSEVDLPQRDDKVAMLLALPDSEKALWDGFKAKLRSQVRRPEKEGCEARLGGAELLDDFYCVFAHNMRDLGTPVYPKRFFAAILATFEEHARLSIVYLHGKPVAAGFLIGHRSTLEIPWASSLREVNRIGANMLMYWSAVRYAVAKGFRCFDFGRSSKDSGTYRFKQQWGAEPQQLRWFYILPDGRPLPQLNPGNPKYRAAIALWKRLPVPVANVLGPLVVKNLP